MAIIIKPNSPNTTPKTESRVPKNDVLSLNSTTALGEVSTASPSGQPVSENN